MSRYYDRDGKEITSDQWSALLGNDSYRTVKQENVGDDYWISTVWLGLDHSYGGGTPLFFETLVVKGDDWAGEEMFRYGSLEEAEAGHAGIVTKYKELHAKEQAPKQKKRTQKKRRG